MIVLSFRNFSVHNFFNAAEISLDLQICINLFESELALL